MRGHDWLIHEVDPGDQRVLTSSPVFGTHTLPIMGAIPRT